MNDMKMSGKAPKDGGVDLSALMNFAEQANSHPEEAPLKQPQTEAPKAPKPASKKAVAAAEKAKPKVTTTKRVRKKEKVARPVVLNFRLSEEENAKLIESAGLVNVSTMIRKALKDQGLI